MLDDDVLEVTAPGRRILVIEAAGGHEGLRIALSDPHDVVLLDLRLPDLAGEEVLRHLHQERPYQQSSSGPQPRAGRYSADV